MEQGQKDAPFASDAEKNITLVEPYESAMERLEACVSSLEGGRLNLEDSLTAFDEGVQLIKYLTKRLDAMEHKMLLLVKDAEGVHTEGMSEDV